MRIRYLELKTLIFEHRSAVYIEVNEQRSTENQGFEFKVVELSTARSLDSIFTDRQIDLLFPLRAVTMITALTYCLGDKFMQRMRGITVIGVLALLILVSILAYVFLPRFLAPSLEASNAKLRVDLQDLVSALDHYRIDNNNYPTTEQGLKALVEQPTLSPVPGYWKQDGYIAAIPLDPWGQPYQYVNEYEVIRVYSYGSKGKDGGSEIDLTGLNKQ